MMIPTHGQIRLVCRQLDKKFENPSPPRSPLGAILPPRYLTFSEFFSAKRNAPAQFQIAPAQFQNAPAQFQNAPAQFQNTPAQFRNAPAHFSVQAHLCRRICPKNLLSQPMPSTSPKDVSLCPFNDLNEYE